ncbi:zf-HC2 domain-containing protein [Micrococcus luteus]|uniref:anti-sigma factor family protein n=1 Tax=Micrococcus luteus TaxID=1270 RepID=UPI0037ECC927|nr:anti-sigma factor [Micrococcus luteus]
MGRRHTQRHMDAYLEGSLPAASRARIARHLDRCPECRATVQARARVLDAARTVHQRPAGAVVAPVLRARGVSGRLVVGLLTFVVLLGGLFTAVWVAGAPRTAAVRTAPTPTDTVALPAAGTASTDRRGTVAELRGQGWTVPSLVGAGLEPLTVDTAQTAEDVEVVVGWGRDEPTVTVRECRPRIVGATPKGCASTAPLSTGAQERRLAGGGVYRIIPAGEQDGWTAELTTPQAAYRVEATLPDERADAVLTHLLVSERARVLELGGGDAVEERLERGLERIADAVPRPRG